MIRLAVLACVLGVALGCNVYVANNNNNNAEWHRNSVIYQIYPRSFKDSNGDGIGDLNGITSRVGFLTELGVTALWLSPIYKSPQVDFGYDISNFTDIDPDYGTLADFDKLVSRAKALGLKVILDFVPNHSSHEHPWFKKSVLRIKPYDEYYIWMNPKMVNGVRHPPNNWLSNFQGSAWEWNDVRKQYYLHQFATGQPDLNYRSPALKQEMQNVLTFWMNRGVDGFRIDAINFMIENSKFLDEPKSNVSGVPADDYDSLNHIYTRDQNETYDILKSWRKLMDDFSNRTKSGARLILTEAYTTHELTVKYYDAGSNVPFNFMFLNHEITNTSTAADYKRLIDKWVSSAQAAKNVPNWVVGNHDNSRVATRFGVKRADQITMLSMILPGVAVVYNGDEIGMVDRRFTYKETVDPAGCNAGPNRYYLKSRDPERTPYQWDDTISAGFSDRSYTWLPVNDNYKTLNLEAQRQATQSHYTVFQALVELKKDPVLASGTVQVSLVTDKVLGVVRRQGSDVVVLLINLADSPSIVNAKAKLNLPAELILHIASIGSNLPVGTLVNTTKLNLPGAASVVYASPDMVKEKRWCFRAKVCI
ncbi:alpha-glucosidase-like [Hylaeus volcanicus]|uniref:alpha-glucosidase-like n=1 Tax=Hylaeus volcanicus TaxID=313075 RepID=UPI0023B81DBE|nr:alpha-glucosidase-like [Hylaeus volcanicus]